MITLERDPTRAIGVRPAVSAVIFDRRGRLLLQQRSDGGQWGLPGGSVEIGESVLDAVAREVHEETGLIVKVRRLIGVYSAPALQLVRYPDGNVWHYVSISFGVRCAAGRCRPATRHWRWNTSRYAGCRPRFFRTIGFVSATPLAEGRAVHSLRGRRVMRRIHHVASS